MIVEDNVTMATVMKHHLSTWGYEVMTVSDFSDILPAFTAFDPHLVLMDILLPFYNGYHWCGEIRKVSQVPVVFLSSAADNMNIIMAMNQGGDDFIPKPVDLSVLTAKLQALLRRAYDLTGRIPVIEHKNAVLNLNDGSLTAMGNRVELTKNEFRILQTLMENRGRIVSRDTLMNVLWQNDCYV